MELFYKQYGAGPPLLILHGLLGASGNWHTLASKVLAEHFSVYALDQRNHGRSPHTDDFDYPLMAEDLLGFIRQHDLGAPHLLGHSMGGKTAMQFALHYPEHTGKLIVVDMAPRAYPPHHSDLIAALQAVDLSVHDSRGEIDAFLAEAIPSRGVRQFLLKNLDYDSAAGQYSWRMNLDAIARNYAAINVGIEAPEPFRGEALFVRGGNSPYVQDDDIPQIEALFPNARLVTIEKAGHWVHAEQPQALAQVVLDFLGTS